MPIAPAPRGAMMAPGGRAPGLPRPTQEQRTTLRLLSAPPPPPLAADLKPMVPSRRELMLQAQDALHETTVWTKELFTPVAPNAPADPPGRSEVCAQLAGARDAATSQLAAEVEEHSAQIREVRESASKMSEVVARRKRPGAESLSADLHASKRAHAAGAAPRPAARGMVVPVAHGESRVGYREPSTGLVQL